MKYFFSLIFLVIMASCSSRTVSESGNSMYNETSIEYADNMSRFNELINSDVPVLVDFYADWCAPCRMMAPILEQVANSMGKQVKVVKVNVDKNKEAAVKYGVRSIPTLILFQSGDVKWQGVGVMQSDQIEHIIRSRSIITAM